MSLIIKGVGMPEKCEDCPCYDYIDYVCRADDCFAPLDVETQKKGQNIAHLSKSLHLTAG